MEANEPLARRREVILRIKEGTVYGLHAHT